MQQLFFLFLFLSLSFFLKITVMSYIVENFFWNVVLAWFPQGNMVSDPGFHACAFQLLGLEEGQKGLPFK